MTREKKEKKINKLKWHKQNTISTNSMHLKCGVRRFKWERQRDIFRENGNIIGPCVKWSPSFVCANAMQYNTTQPRIQFDTKRVILVLVFVVCIHIELSNSINFLFIFSCFNTFFGMRRSFILISLDKLTWKTKMRFSLFGNWVWRLVMIQIELLSLHLKGNTDIRIKYSLIEARKRALIYCF